MTLEISRTTISHKQSWSDLWREYLRFYETELPDEIFESSFNRFSDPNIDNMYSWLAWLDGKPVGLVNVIIHPDSWRQEPVTYLQDLYVDHSARCRGVARALIETVYKDADAAGRSSVYWLTQENNHTAQTLYDKLAKKSDFLVYERN